VAFVTELPADVRSVIIDKTKTGCPVQEGAEEVFGDDQVAKCLKRHLEFIHMPGYEFER
jgi:hypothetical protein